jgi:hypothetical protein
MSTLKVLLAEILRIASLTVSRTRECTIASLGSESMSKRVPGANRSAAGTRLSGTGHFIEEASIASAAVMAGVKELRAEIQID